METLIGAIIGAILGGIATYYVTRLLRREEMRGREVIIMKFRFRMSELLGKFQAQILKKAQERCPNEEIEKWQICGWVVASVGMDVIRDLKIAVFAEPPGQIAGWGQDMEWNVQGSRVSVLKEPPDRLICKWDFLNPGELLVIKVIAIHTENPDSVHIEADAEQLHVRQYSSMDRIPPTDLRKLRQNNAYQR